MRRLFGGGVSAEGKKEENTTFRSRAHDSSRMGQHHGKTRARRIISPAASKEMLDLMKREQGTNGIWREQWRVPKATKSGALDALRSNVGILYHPRGRIALAITCNDMPEVSWTVDNPALLLMSRLSEILLDGLGGVERAGASPGHLSSIISNLSFVIWNGYHALSHSDTNPATSDRGVVKVLK